MIHCSVCQHELPDNSRFCGFCGSKVQTQSQTLECSPSKTILGIVPSDDEFAELRNSLEMSPVQPESSDSSADNSSSKANPSTQIEENPKSTEKIITLEDEYDEDEENDEDEDEDENEDEEEISTPSQSELQTFATLEPISKETAVHGKIINADAEIAKQDDDNHHEEQHDTIPEVKAVAPRSTPDSDTISNSSSITSLMDGDDEDGWDSVGVPELISMSHLDTLSSPDDFLSSPKNTAENVDTSAEETPQISSIEDQTDDDDDEDDEDEEIRELERLMAQKKAEKKAKREAEKKAKREAEEKAKREAEEKAKREAEEKAKREAEEKAKREAEEIAKREAEEKAKREAVEKAKREAEETSVTSASDEKPKSKKKKKKNKSKSDNNTDNANKSDDESDNPEENSVKAENKADAEAVANEIRKAVLEELHSLDNVKAVSAPTSKDKPSEKIQEASRKEIKPVKEISYEKENKQNSDSILDDDNFEDDFDLDSEKNFFGGRMSQQIQIDPDFMKPRTTNSQKFLYILLVFAILCVLGLIIYLLVK